ncbi:MAG: AfsR/SARP family transcriptional regulator, partial [Micromonosporaceae bacterium]
MAPPPAPSDELEIRLLGTFEITRHGVPIDVLGDRLRTAMASLALAVGRVVAADALIDVVWSDRLPGNPRSGLQNLITRLRKVLGVDVIRSVGRGYLLEIAPEQVDVVRFQRHLDAAAGAESAGDTAAVRRHLRAAEQLWRGEPLTGVESEVLRLREVQSLTERYLTAVEQRIDIDLAGGRVGGLVSELVGLTTRHRLRESLWLRLIKVLHRQGRQSEALTAYHDLRTLLADELGVQPSPDLQEVYQAILTSDLPAPASAESGPAGEPAPAAARPDWAV